MFIVVQATASFNYPRMKEMTNDENGHWSLVIGHSDFDIRHLYYGVLQAASHQLLAISKPL